MECQIQLVCSDKSVYYEHRKSTPSFNEDTPLIRYQVYIGGLTVYTYGPNKNYQKKLSWLQS